MIHGAKGRVVPLPLRFKHVKHGDLHFPTWGYSLVIFEFAVKCTAVVL